MQNLGVILRTFWEKAVSYLTLQMSLTDIIEIIIISVLIYYMLVWIKDTRAWMLLRGILVILAFVLLAVLFEMNTIVWIADKQRTFLTEGAEATSIPGFTFQRKVFIVHLRRTGHHHASVSEFHHGHPCGPCHTLPSSSVDLADHSYRRSESPRDCSD